MDKLFTGFFNGACSSVYEVFLKYDNYVRPIYTVLHFLAECFLTRLEHPVLLF